MKTLNLYVAIVCFVAAIVIFVFASGARRIYSGAFFALLGAVNIAILIGKKD
jgi:hypothetical protein